MMYKQTMTYVLLTGLVLTAASGVCQTSNDALRTKLESYVAAAEKDRIEIEFDLFQEKMDPRVLEDCYGRTADVDLQALCVKLLQVAGDKQSVRWLNTIYHGADVLAQTEVLVSLSVLDKPSGLHLARGALASPDDEVFRVAMFVLSESSSAEDWQLMKGYLSNTNEKRRSAALLSAHPPKGDQKAEHEMMVALIESSKHPAEAVRLTVVQRLSYDRNDYAESILSSMVLDDQSLTVREKALGLLLFIVRYGARESPERTPAAPEPKRVRPLLPRTIGGK
ncbi:MAG: hypothetical protein WD716_00005 [Fimbriimonadaceae bacterium]